MAETKKDTLGANEVFLVHYMAKSPHACECMWKDKAVLSTFSDFRAEHWSHIRTSKTQAALWNPLEVTLGSELQHLTVSPFGQECYHSLR